MKICTILLTLTWVPAFAQPPAEPSEQPPADVDAALRARVSQFYQAQVSGKYGAAFEVVADEFKDAYIGSDKGSFKSCETAKIAYTDGFEKAKVTEACKTEWKWHGRSWPVTVPLTSFWRVMNGQWYWYAVKQTEFETPWGISRITEDKAEGANATTTPSVLPDPIAAAKSIMQMVRIDKTEVKLDPSKVSQDEVVVTNAMPGTIFISIDNIGQPGLTVKSDKTQLGAGEKARVVLKFDPDDPSVQCEDCVKRMKGSTTARIIVRPTNQVFQVTVVFVKPAIDEKKQGGQTVRRPAR